MKHDVALNIHYSAPNDVWEKIDNVYCTMPYWSGTDQEARWTGTDIDLWASVEPGGIQIAGTMPEDIWQVWYSMLKENLSDALGYEIGELENGYDFKYWD